MKTAGWGACLLGLTLVAGCSGRPSPQEDVRQALERANVRDIEVRVDPSAKVVHLAGTVRTPEERSRAEQVAAAAVGTSGRVANELEVVGMSDAMSEEDRAILNRLDVIVDADPVLKQRDINFAVAAGTVTVTGEVRSDDEKDVVSQIVQDESGVTAVVNRLDVRRDQ